MDLVCRTYNTWSMILVTRTILHVAQAILVNRHTCYVCTDQSHLLVLRHQLTSFTGSSWLIQKNCTIVTYLSSSSYLYVTCYLVFLTYVFKSMLNDWRILSIEIFWQVIMLSVYVLKFFFVFVNVCMDTHNDCKTHLNIQTLIFKIH